MKKIFTLATIVLAIFVASCSPSIIDDENKLTLNIGDENMIFEKDTSINIEWSYNGDIQNIKLELLYNNQFELLIKDSISADKKTFDWKIPNSLEERKNYTLKISDINNPDVKDTLNISFVNKGYENYTINPNTVSDNLYISSPNGGIFEMGKEKTITWLTKNISFITYIRVELFYNNNYYLTIVDKVAFDNDDLKIGGGGGLGGNTLGRIIWNIPEYIDDTLQYKIVIRNYNKPNEYNISNYITIVKNGTKTFDIRDLYSSTTYIAGYSYWIGWNYTGDIKNVKLELLKDGIPFSVIEESLLVTNIYEGNPAFAYYDWIIDETIAENDKYSIRISEVGNPSNNDTTSNFEILDADTKILNLAPVGSPNAVGSTIFMSWDFIGDIEYIKIELLKNDVVYYVIDNNYKVNLFTSCGVEQETTTNNGGLDWIIPNTTEEGDDYKIKITDLNDNTVFDETPLFSILSNS